MDNADYLDVALRLANAALDDIEALRAALHDEPWWADRVTEDDLRALRPVARGLRDAFEAATRADDAAVLRSTNELLARHPPRPRLSAGHATPPPDTMALDTMASDTVTNWHVHVADVDAPPATEVAAAAAWGVAQGIVRYGLERWGRCAAEDCASYFVDTSTNRAKRFCSARCANRVHVAAFRSRQK